MPLYCVYLSIKFCGVEKLLTCTDRNHFNWLQKLFFSLAEIPTTRDLFIWSLQLQRVQMEKLHVPAIFQLRLSGALVNALLWATGAFKRSLHALIGFEHECVHVGLP